MYMHIYIYICMYVYIYIYICMSEASHWFHTILKIIKFY